MPVGRAGLIAELPQSTPAWVEIQASADTLLRILNPIRCRKVGYKSLHSGYQSCGRSSRATPTC